MAKKLLRLPDGTDTSIYGIDIDVCSYSDRLYRRYYTLPTGRVIWYTTSAAEYIETWECYYHGMMELPNVIIPDYTTEPRCIEIKSKERN